MRRRFGRRRTGGSSRTPIDARAVLTRIAEQGVVSAGELEPREVPGVAPSLAAVGTGKDDSDRPLVVAFAPHGGDAVLAALAAGVLRHGEGDFDGGVAVAVAPVWTPDARRLLAVAAPREFDWEAREVPALGEGDAGPRPEEAARPAVVPVEQAVDALADGRERELYARAAAGLAGLAAKHDGAVRGVPGAVELVLQARRVARLFREPDGLMLEIFQPSRDRQAVTGAGLADLLDRLEGQLRKRLNDRKVRDGEEGLRSRVLADLADSAGLRSLVRWPLPREGSASGTEEEVLDLAGLDPEGKPVVGAVRRRVELEDLCALLEAALAVPAAMPVLFARALPARPLPPVRVETPRLLLAAESFGDGVLNVLSQISLEVSRVDLAAAGLGVETVSEGREPAAARGRTGRGSRSRREGGEGRDGREGRDAGRRRARRGGRRRRGAAGDGEDAAEAGSPAEAADSPEAGERGEAPAAAKPPRFEELTAFDLDDVSSDEEPRRGRRRRSGRRRRERRDGGDANGGRDAEAEAEPEEARRPRAGPEPTEPEEAELELDEGLVPLVAEAPEAEEEPTPEVRYDDDDETEGEPESEEERLRREREARRRARVAKAAPQVEEPARPERPRRAAILAHADRESVGAALLLAREARVLDGLWVYPQDELMTFFRSVATDLRDDTTVLVVGFVASPARDAIQAASLYRGRIEWFDHHDWPPEDHLGMSSAVGEETLRVVPGLDTPLPLAMERCTRRSRFSDKLVDLLAARFTEHDFTRWGRVWWARVGELAERTGDRRGDIEPLLAGRPSDLAREARTVEPPPPPPELAWVNERDFLLDHFGGYTLVRVATPPSLSPQLAARIARERYRAQLSLSWREGEECVALGGDDAWAKRGLDLESMAEHLANKHSWVELLPSADHVARVRIHQLASEPERLDAVVSEIAMGRSILEG